MRQTVEELAAELYDVIVPDWPGEIDFYRQLAAEAKSRREAVLEVACGTGRIAFRLAQMGVDIVGIDLSPEMLAIARAKCSGMRNIRLVQCDMSSFDLQQTFGLVIIPGHSFQAMLTPQDQVACLETIKRHLAPGGTLVVHLDHQDILWLAGLGAENGGIFKAAGEFTHPRTGSRLRASRAWTYQPASQTAESVTVWEEVGADGQVRDRWQRPPMRLHCVFRYEMEHLLARVGLQVQALCGDFCGGSLSEQSTEMIWMVKNPRPAEANDGP